MNLTGTEKIIIEDAINLKIDKYITILKGQGALYPDLKERYENKIKECRNVIIKIRNL